MSKQPPVFTTPDYDSEPGKDFDARVRYDPMLGGTGPSKHFDIGFAMESHRIWLEQDAEDKAAIRALGEAERTHHVYGAAELALKEAIQSLEVLLLRYEEVYGDPSQLWRITSPNYQYTKDLFAPCLSALKAARKFNESRGEQTYELVKQARERCNPEEKKQVKEQSKEAERAMRFCASFLKWVTKYDEPLTGETK